MKKFKKLLMVKIVEFIVVIICMFLMWMGIVSGFVPTAIIVGLLILGICYDVFLIVYVLKLHGDSKE